MKGAALGKSFCQAEAKKKKHLSKDDVERIPALAGGWTRWPINILFCSTLPLITL